MTKPRILPTAPPGAPATAMNRAYDSMRHRAEERGHGKRTMGAGVGGLLGAMAGSFRGGWAAAAGAAVGALVGAVVGEVLDQRTAQARPGQDGAGSRREELTAGSTAAPLAPVDFAERAAARRR